MSSVSLRNVTKKCPNNDVVVKNFTLDIGDGEFVVLAGPTGCGKTIVIRMIAGLEESDSGDICIDNDIVNDKEPKDRGVAMVFQNYALYPNMNVYDNIAFALKLLRMPSDEIDKKVKETAEFMGIESLLDKMPEALSEIETLQTVIARAIVKDPKALLMDDTLARLEGEKKRYIEEKMAALQRKMKIPFIYATQGQEEAMTMATRIVVMKEGEVQQDGSPEELYQNPANTFVALFLGDPRMVMLQAAVGKNSQELNIGENKILLPEEKAAVLKEKGYGGKNVFLGIRPENMEILQEGKAEGKSRIIGAQAVQYEEVNGKKYLQAALDETLLAVPAEEEKFSSGDVVDLAFSTEKIHIFCAETGEAVC